MRRTIFSMLIVLLAAPFVGDAQDDAIDNSAYGYSSITYDPNTGQVTAYSETDMDSTLEPYYVPEINVTIWDNLGNHYENACKYDSNSTTYISATCVFTPANGSYQYSISGSHWAWLNDYYEPCAGEPGCQPEYLDPWELQLLESEGIDYPFEAIFPTSYAPAATDSSPDAVMGGTTDYDTIQVWACPNDPYSFKGGLLAEYAQVFGPLPNGRYWKSSYNPSCSDFTWFTQYVQDGYYTWQQLTVDQSTGAGVLAILQSTLNQQLTYMSDAALTHFSISSGYRNPAAQVTATIQNCSNPTAAKCQPFAARRHMTGDAADVRTYDNQITWNAYRTVAKKANGCVEPQTYSSLSHLHVDWMTLNTLPDLYRKKTCDPGW